MDTLLHVTEDGGKTFRPLGERWKHVDNHALWIDPHDSDHLVVGCDGGLYQTWDRGQSYRYTENLPITQFYKIAVDNDAPFYNVYGGTQDNATQGGPSRTNNVHGIRNSDWFVTVFGDGFDPVIDPTNPNIIYSQWQYGGLVRYDRRSGERIDIKPQEDKNGPPLRWNWDSALILSPHSPTRLYYAAQILFRSDDRGDTWKAISPDLTRNIDRNKLKVMGRRLGRGRRRQERLDVVLRLDRRPGRIAAGGGPDLRRHRRRPDPGHRGWRHHLAQGRELPVHEQARGCVCFRHRNIAA